MRAVTKSVAPSAPPNAQLAGVSGTLSVPQRAPSGAKTATPSAVVTKRFPSASTAMPSALGVPSTKRRSPLALPFAATSKARTSPAAVSAT